jgi:hypothetical protein
VRGKESRGFGEVVTTGRPEIAGSSAPRTSAPPFSASAPASAFIRAGRPNSNGCVERVQLTILEECSRPAFARSLVPKSSALKQDLDEYLTA